MVPAPGAVSEGLGHPADGIVGIGNCAAVCVAGPNAPVQRVVVKGGDLVLAVGEFAEIAGKIVLVTLCTIQRVLSRRQPIHVVIRVRRRLILGIRHGEWYVRADRRG